MEHMHINVAFVPPSAYESDFQQRLISVRAASLQHSRRLLLPRINASVEWSNFLVAATAAAAVRDY
jgi:hypothetical protein